MQAASIRSALLVAVCVAMIALGWWRLSSATSGLSVISAYAGSTPVTVFKKADAVDAPVVVIAHGFAGSQQLMQPLAVTLSRNGYIAVTFDFLGHGRNPEPLSGNITEESGATRALVDQTAKVMTYARSLPGAGGGLALLGHSMASDIVVRAAQAEPNVKATVAVSMFSPVVTRESPRNLLVIVGALEPAAMQNEGRRVVAMVSGERPSDGVTYGRFEDGTARRFVRARGVEHVSVLFSHDSLAEALDWLDQAFARPAAGALPKRFLDTRGWAIGLVLFGLIALARPLSAVLPSVADPARGGDEPWCRLLAIGAAPAILTPLLLWKAPTDFLPILVGDYLAIHFALYGLLTAAGLWFAGNWSPRRGPSNMGLLALSVLAVAFYSVAVIGYPIDHYVTSFTPVAGRVPLFFAMLAGMLPYFLTDEWLTRGQHARHGAYAATKALFLVSLAVAVALNLEKLFFLAIIVPVILIFFLVYGLFSSWVYRRTGHPFVAAIANAIAFAWALAATFPVLGG